MRAHLVPLPRRLEGEVCDSDTRLEISRRERRQRGLPDIPSRDLYDSDSDTDSDEAVEEDDETRDGRERTRRSRDRRAGRSRAPADDEAATARSSPTPPLRARASDDRFDASATFASAPSSPSITPADR